MPDLKIEVNNGKLNAWVNNKEIGAGVTRLVFVADSTGEESSVNLSLKIDGEATIKFGKNGVTFSPLVTQMAGIIQSAEMSE